MAKWQVTTFDGQVMVVEAEEVTYDEYVVVLGEAGRDDGTEAIIALNRLVSVVKLADEVPGDS